MIHNSMSDGLRHKVYNMASQLYRRIRNWLATVVAAAARLARPSASAREME